MKYAALISLLASAVYAQANGQSTSVQNQSGTATPGQTPSPYITPAAAAPSGYKTSTAGYFGIQVVNVTASSSAAQSAATGLAKRRFQLFGRQVGQISDGQLQAATSATPVRQISDGQIQAATTATPATRATTAVTPVKQISDGQIQAATSPAVSIMYVTVTTTVTKNNCVATPIQQISDGQIQAPMATPVRQISDGQIQAPTARTSSATPVRQISDGQVQAPTVQTSSATPVRQISDGQVQAATTVRTSTATPARQISDGQVQAATSSRVTGASQLSDGQIQRGTSTSSSAMSMATMSGQAQTCYRSGILATSLVNGILVDSVGRYGEIVANQQFQFDLEPQAGAKATGGWSIAPNGTLTLGNSSIFYQCLSGNFYNIYAASLGQQCNQVYIETIQLNNDC